MLGNFLLYFLSKFFNDFFSILKSTFSFLIAFLLVFLCRFPFSIYQLIIILINNDFSILNYFSKTFEIFFNTFKKLPNIFFHKSFNGYSFTVLQCSNDLDAVSLVLDIKKDRSLKLLVDTGSAISILKQNSIDEDTLCYPQNKCKISGISAEPLVTLAQCSGNICLDDELSVNQKFQVVSNNFPLPCDGILGKDFLKANLCKIDYSKNVLEISVNNKNFNFKLFSYNKPINDFLEIIPARTEKLIKIPFDSKMNGDYVCTSNEISDGIFLANSIITIKDKFAYSSIMNLTENDFTMNNFDIKVEPLNLFNVYYFDQQFENSNCSRLSELESLISIEHLNSEESKSIVDICREFNDIFLLKDDKLSKTDSTEHKILTKNNVKPVFIKPYRLPESAKKEIDLQINQMLEDGVIEPSHSPWNFPLLIVPKKSDSTGRNRWRVVVDFRRLNEITVDDVFPLPNIIDILEKLGKSTYFSTLDMANGYHQVPLNANDREKTGFSTPNGHFHFLRMPQGLKGAPATFQRLMNQILSGLNGVKCLVYLDDIIVYGVNLADHNTKLVDVFRCLRKNNLKLNPNKCNFLHKEIKFLGHVVSADGIKADPKKIEAIIKYPVPKCVKDVQAFVGLSGYYRKFIPNFSRIASPLLKLLKKGVDFHWNAFCEEAFSILKNALITSPILQYPDYTKEFHVTCDASEVALGAVLSQEYDGFELPIVYASRTTNSAEKNYSAIEKELLAIVWGIEQFRPYVFGRNFVVFTDHKPLKWLWNIKDPNSRLMRWRIKLEEYNFDIRHTPGVSNQVADAFSRIEPHEQISVITRSKTKQLNKNDSEEPSELFESDNDSDIVVESKSLKNDIIKLNTTSEIENAISQFHDSPLGGHQGVNRTFNRMKEYFKFPKMLSKIKEYIKYCSKCQKNKSSRPNKMPMVITTTSSRPFERVALDIVGPLNPITLNNNSCILTLQDDLTKYSVAVPLPNQEADTVARAFVNNFICIYGAPFSILTDQGTNFLSDLFKQVNKILKIKKLQTSPYHPQTNGALEKSHHSLSNYLRNFASDDPNNWDTWVPFAMFCYNSTPHTVTQFMPFELLFGHKPQIPSSFLKSPEPLYTYDDYAKELKYRMQKSNEIAKENINKSKEKSKLHYDQHIKSVKFSVGDSVLLRDESKKGKLSPPWLGPFIVVEVLSDENTRIKIGNTVKTVHNNRLKRFFEHKLS